jgi:hypothetical protein
MVALLFVPLSMARAAGWGECSVPGLTILSDVAGAPSASVSLVVDKKSKAIKTIELDVQGTKTNFSAKLLSVLAQDLNEDFKEDSASVELRNLGGGIQQVTAKLQDGVATIDINIDGAPNIKDVMNLTGHFDTKTGGACTIDCKRGFNPLHSRTKISLALKHDGPNCEDWHFYAVTEKGERPIAGLIFKANTLFGNIVGVDQIVPIDVDAQKTQSLISMLTDPSIRANRSDVDRNPQVTEKLEKAHATASSRSTPRVGSASSAI